MRAITRLNSGDLLLCHIFAVWNCPRIARIMWEMLVIVCIKWQLRRRVVVMVIHLFSSQVLWVAFDPVSKPRPTHPLAQLMHAVWIMMACYDPRLRGHFGIAWSVCLSVQWHSCLGYRHTAGCLQLSHRQPPEICGLQTRLRTDVDLPWFLDWSAISGGHIILPAPGAIPCSEHAHCNGSVHSELNWPATSRASYTTRSVVTQINIMTWLAAAKPARLVLIISFAVNKP